MKVCLLVLLIFIAIAPSLANVTCPDYDWYVGSILGVQVAGGGWIFSTARTPWASTKEVCIYWEKYKRIYIYDNVGFDFQFNTQKRENVHIKMFGYETKTYKPFNDQVVEQWTVDPAVKKPCATARLKIDVLPNNPVGSYYKGEFQGAGNDWMEYVNTADSDIYPNKAYVSYSSDSIFDGGIKHYRQTNYSQSYSKVSGATIRAWGCFMTSICNVLATFGITISPSDMNYYLKLESDGFVGLKVNSQAVARIIKKRYGISLKVVRGLSVDEALARNIPTITSVHNSGHWVAIFGKAVVEGGAIKTRILDPNGVRDVEFLEDYSGFSTSNTRSFYRMISPAPTKTNLATQSISTSDLASSNISTQDSSLSFDQGSDLLPNYLSSSVTAMSSDTSLRLLLTQPNRSTVASEDEQFENQETGETINTGPIAEIGNAPPGDYVLIIIGEPGHQYNVVLSEQDDQASPTIKTLSGQLNAEGKVEYNFYHGTVGYILGLSALYEAPIGETTILLDGVITAITGPDEMIIQPYEKRVPAVLVKGVAASKPMLGKKINWLKGTVTEQSDGRRFVNYISGYQNIVLQDYPSSVQYKVKAVGVPVEKLSTTSSLYSRIVARVTADNGYNSLTGQYSVTLNNTLTAVSLSAFDLSVGKLVVLNGVERNGTFYVAYPEDKQILN
ncbi:MAG: hypothetical protein WC536_04410 [Patescibacteria group bacterium]